jgi:tRNA A-37 threonylcarbamoyl transferase component Bud32/predicted nucleotidyltransferase
MKSKLTDEERSMLISYAESMVPKEVIHSLCAYGSRVAGCAREDSDYDIIIVTKKFKENVTARPEIGQKKSSPIIVDEEVLCDAAMHPSSGELVIGRFLNIYDPLINEDFLRKVEIEYKKRIIAEDLIEIQTAYDDFSSNLILPYEYFLFNKLHKRALGYPDAIDSYGRTYKGVPGKDNLEFTLQGFREAAEMLASIGILEKSDDSVRIFRGRTKRLNALTTLYKMYPLAVGGYFHNAIHSLTSRAGFEYITKPIQMLMVNDKVESMVELERPNKLLRLEEGIIFDDASKMVEELARLMGFSEKYEFNEKKMGDFINSSSRLEIWDDARRVKFILKHFPELKSAKWLVLNIWSYEAKKFNITPLSRLNREVEAVRQLHRLGINTHRITGIILDERTLVSEYVEGVPLFEFVLEILTGKSTDTTNIRIFAQILGKMHHAGLVYGDTKPENVLISKDGIYLLDLEQAEEGGDEAWDLAEFLYYTAMLEKSEEGMKLVAESFLDAYRAQNGDQVIAKARNLRYLTPFRLFLSPEMSKIVEEALVKYSSMESLPVV